LKPEDPQFFGKNLADTHTTMVVVSNPFAAFQSFVLTGLLIFLKLGIQQIMKGNFNSFM
jgi:hypothetical protein